MTETTQVYQTAGGVEVTRSIEELALDSPLETVLEALNARRGECQGPPPFGVRMRAAPDGACVVGWVCVGRVGLCWCGGCV